MRKVFTDDLPRMGKLISWVKSIGYKVKFIYDDIEGWVEIIDCKSSILYIKYTNNIFKITTEDFKKCKMGGILKLHTKNFKCNINENIVDNKRNITIIDREYRVRYKKNSSKCNDKYYKYKCNKCGNEDWIYEGNLLNQELGCNVCCFPSQKIVLGINTIWDTDRWMCDLGISEEDAKTHTKCSHDKIKVTCPDCGRTKKITIANIHTYKSIKCSCSDKVSYPQKFMWATLEQLNINFKKEFAPKWCRYIDFNNINKIKVGRYDFLLYDTYIEGKEVIVETDGRWHSKDNNLSGQRKEESEYIDFTKDTLALENGYEVIRIDCEKSELEFIKQNILNSKLSEIFDLSIIDWLKCEEFALSNRVKEACDYKKDNPNITVSEISNIMKLDSSTIRRYLHKGHKLGWCYYVTNK